MKHNKIQMMKKALTFPDIRSGKVFFKYDFSLSYINSWQIRFNTFGSSISNFCFYRNNHYDILV